MRRRRLEERIRCSSRRRCRLDRGLLGSARPRRPPMMTMRESVPDAVMVAELNLPILTARLRLRRLAPEDAAPIARLMTPAVSRWVASWPVPFTEAMALERIEATRARRIDGPLAVTRRADDVFMGTIGLHRHADDPRRAELGFWLGEPFQRRGHATEAARALIGAGFAQLGLEVVEAGAQLGNAASIAVLRKLGMTPLEVRSVHASARARFEECLYFAVGRAADPNPCAPDGVDRAL